MSLISLFGAARFRVVQGTNSTLAGALTGKPDRDEGIQAIDTAYTSIPRNTPSLDALEIMIARRVDQGESLPVGEPNVMRGAQWLSRLDPATLPDPMPRDFVLYLAQALVDAGKFQKMEDAVKNILSNHTFF